MTIQPFSAEMLNASTTFIPPGMSGKFVSIENCQGFVEGVKGWNTVYQVCLAGLLILYFYTLYKCGLMEKEVTWIKNIFKKSDDEEEEENG